MGLEFCANEIPLAHMSDDRSRVQIFQIGLAMPTANGALVFAKNFPDRGIFATEAVDHDASGLLIAAALS